MALNVSSSPEINTVQIVVWHKQNTDIEIYASRIKQES